MDFAPHIDRRLKSDRHLERERTCTYANRGFAAKGEWGKESLIVLDIRKLLPKEQQVSSQGMKSLWSHAL
jgi:hypothetical protein